ncbi:MAG: dTMP kinase [Sinobacterium sp.]|nr:dTMP kinase [Sinobacterium sp.]
MSVKKNKGLFLVLEGGEGVGKTTNMAFIQSYLKQANIKFQHSREPGGTPLAEKIRELILTKHSENVSNMTELLLMFAARAQHIQVKINPVLDSGEWLVCDRFTDATYAYQGGGRGFDKQLIEQLEQLVQQDLRPDCTIILDAPVEVGFARASARAELDRMESESVNFHQAVRASYLERAKQMPEKYAVINADQPLDNVQAAIKIELDRLIEKYHA